MTADEFGTFIFDLLSEATHVVETIAVKETPDGSVLVVGLKNGALHHVSVRSPQDN